MKRIIFILLIFISLTGIAQRPPGYTQYYSNNAWTRAKFDSTITIPRYDGAPASFKGGWGWAGALGVDTTNNDLYFHSNGVWRRLGDSLKMVTWQRIYKVVDSLVDAGWNKNIYNSDGTLTGNRTVTQSTNKLIFDYSGTTGSGTNAGFKITGNSLTTGTGFYVTSTSLTSGSLAYIDVTSTAASGNGQKALVVNSGGANSNSNQKTYAGHFTNQHSGTGSINYGIYSEVINNSGASYGVYAIADSSNSSGVVGYSANGTGVYGATNGGMGVYGFADVTGGVGVTGDFNLSTSGTGTAIQGISDGSGGGTHIAGLFGASGSAGTNIAGKFEATGGSTNYAIIVPASSGSVGFGTSTPAKQFHNVGTVRLASLGTASTDTTTYKPLGIDSNGDVFPMTYWPGGGAGGGATAYNGLSNGVDGIDSVRLGGTLNQNTTIQAGGYYLLINGTTQPFLVSSTSGIAVDASATTGIAISGNTNGTGGVAGNFQHNPSSTNSVIPVLNIKRITQGTADDGIGGSIDFYLEAVDGTGYKANQFISKFTTAAAATRTSSFIITGVNSGSTDTVVRWSGNGLTRLDKYNLSGSFKITDTSTYKPIVVDTSGNLYRSTYWYSSGGTTPNLQQVMDIGGTSNGNNLTINDGDGNTFIQYYGQERQVNLGDIGLTHNGTYLQINDSTKIISIRAVEGMRLVFGALGDVGFTEIRSQLSITNDTVYLPYTGNGIDTFATLSDIRDFGGGGTPGGSDTQVQYNSSGSFAGSTKFTFTSASGLVTASAFSAVGTGGAGYMDFIAQSSDPSAPSAGTARIHSETTQGFTRMNLDNEGSTDIVYARDNVIVVRNQSGSTISKGEVVYVSGATGNVPQVTKARANSLTTLPVIGVALDDMTSPSFGQVMTSGIITGINTSSYSVGDQLYTSTATAGAVQNTRPSGTSGAYVQRIGSVLSSGASGTILVMIAPFIGNVESGTTSATWRIDSTINLGTASSKTGVLNMYNRSSGDGVSIIAPSNITSWNWQVPPNDGNAGQFLKTDGSGVTTWASIDTSDITSFYLKVRGLLSAGSGISYNSTTGVISMSVTVDSIDISANDYTMTNPGFYRVKVGDSGNTYQINLPDPGAFVGATITITDEHSDDANFAAYKVYGPTGAEVTRIRTLQSYTFISDGTYWRAVNWNSGTYQ